MQVTVTVDFEMMHCPDCGIHYQVPTTYMNECRRDPTQYFHCPAGHPRHFSESEADRLRRERDKLKQDAARLNDEIAAERRRADDAEKKAARERKRTAAGVCPCCNRTFRQLALHMKNKHANVVALEQKPALRRATGRA